MSQSISAASGEQTTNARQVSKAVESVNEITQGAATAAEEMSSSTEQLSSLAQELQQLVAQFRIGAQRDEQPQHQPALAGVQASSEYRFVQVRSAPGAQIEVHEQLGAHRAPGGEHVQLVHRRVPRDAQGRASDRGR